MKTTRQRVAGRRRVSLSWHRGTRLEDSNTEAESDTMGLLTAEQFKKPLPRRYTTVPVPAFGEGAQVRFQSLTEDERSAFELAGSGENREDRLADLKRRFLVATVVDGNGQTVLSHADIEEMGQQDSAVVDALFDIAWAHVGYKKSDIASLVGEPTAG